MSQLALKPGFVRVFITSPTSSKTEEYRIEVFSEDTSECLVRSSGKTLTEATSNAFSWIQRYCEFK